MMTQPKHIDVRRTYEFQLTKEADWFITYLFRRRLLRFNDEYDLTIQELMEYRFPEDEIVFKWSAESFDCSAIISDDSVQFYHDDRLIETTGSSLSKTDISFLKVADKSLKFSGGTGKRIICVDSAEDVYRFGSEENFPWFFVLYGHAWQVIK